jgi:hypothetical protein
LTSAVSGSMRASWRRVELDACVIFAVGSPA